MLTHSYKTIHALWRRHIRRYDEYSQTCHTLTNTHQQKQTTEVHINLSIFDKRAFCRVTNNMFHFTKPNPSLSTVYITAKQQQAAKHHITDRAIIYLATIQQRLNAC